MSTKAVRVAANATAEALADAKMLNAATNPAFAIRCREYSLDWLRVIAFAILIGQACTCFGGRGRANVG